MTSAGERTLTPAERFGQRVAAARAARGWSMRDLCAKAGVAAPSTIKRCEDDGCVSLSLAVRIAAVLGVSMDGLGDTTACWTCGGSPPRGFTCNECGTGGAR
jgi:transcriptional regulator with XRE-family HTH domain